FSHLLMQSSWQNRFLRCRVSLHAVIDNYSRRILGWCVEKLLNPLAALETLSAAGADNLSPAESSPDEAGARIVMDSGVENVNGIVDGFFDSGQLRRVLAQVDVTFSNSLIEAWWRSL